jgi:hypothetical protein
MTKDEMVKLLRSSVADFNAWRRCNPDEAIDLSGASFAWNDLSGANLSDASLREADFYRADLTGANLSDSNLYRAMLTDSKLTGVRMSWGDHALISEILKRGAGDDVNRLMIAGLIAIRPDWCWREFLAIDHLEKEWALRELAMRIQPGDELPELFERVVRELNIAGVSQ